MSEFNINVEGGTSYRLRTAGKYCDRDIVVTAEGGGIVPSGEIKITDNGTYDVTEHASAVVAVPQFGKLECVSGSFTTTDGPLTDGYISIEVGFQPSQVYVFAGALNSHEEYLRGVSETGRQYIVMMSVGYPFGSENAVNSYITASSNDKYAKIMISDDAFAQVNDLAIEIQQNGFLIYDNGPGTFYTYGGTYRYYAYK